MSRRLTRAQTRLLAIWLRKGKGRAVTPVAELEPVRLGGVITTRAYILDPDLINGKGVHLGDCVTIERAPAGQAVVIAAHPQEGGSRA